MEPLDHPEKFLSTPSARRATWHTAPRGLPCKFLSTPSARRATRNYVAPRLTELFLSTPSARRATFFDCQQDEVIRISIHALREEGDRAADTYRRQYHDFYPRPPRGGRRVSNTYIVMTERFLSTPSARRATAAGSTGTSASTNFYPRPPRGGRRYGRGLEIEQAEFLSTPSARRATFEGHQGNAAGYDFYPRPPRGGRHRS